MNTNKFLIYGILLLASVLLVASTSCEKEDDDPTPPVENGDNGENGENNGEYFEIWFANRHGSELEITGFTIKTDTGWEDTSKIPDGEILGRGEYFTFLVPEEDVPQDGLIQYRVTVEHDSESYLVDESFSGNNLSITTQVTDEGKRYARIQIVISGGEPYVNSVGCTAIFSSWTEGDDDYEPVDWQ